MSEADLMNGAQPRSVTHVTKQAGFTAKLKRRHAAEARFRFSDLERIGDYAANIAKRSLALVQVPVVRPVMALPRMGRMVQQIIKDVLDAYTERDLEKALSAWRQDESVDDLYTSLFRETLTYMMEDPRNITPCTHLLFIAKNIERIGDHATNIAELIHFLLTGKPVTDVRPKGDATSFTVVTPEAKPEENA